MKMLIAALLIAMPFVSAAESLMSAEEFEKSSEGRTLFFINRAGRTIGAEFYRPGRKTKWLPTGGVCEDATWRDAGDRLCFTYESGEVCWRVFGDSSGPTRFELQGDATGAATLRVSHSTPVELVCPGEDDA